MKQVTFNKLFIPIGLLLSSTVLTSCSDHPTINEDNQIIISGIEPPLGEQIPYESFRFHTDSNTVIVRSSGSRIAIPANSIIDKNGQAIKGEVELKVREFYSTKEILLSGIVMQLGNSMDSVLSSAGMIDIRAFANEEEVFIAKDKSVKIDLPSYREDVQNYQLFKLENDSAWSQGTAFEQTKNTLKDSLIAVSDSTSKGLDRRFKLQMDDTGRPHLSSWIGVEWNLLSLKGDVSFKRTKEIIWEYFTMEPYGDSVTFKLELTSAIYWNGGDEKRFSAMMIAQPLLSPEQIAKRLKLQRDIEFKEGNAYRSALAQEKQFKANYSNERKAWIKEYERADSIRKEEAKLLLEKYEAQNALMNSFTISSFGIYNIDCAVRLNSIGNVLVQNKTKEDMNSNFLIALWDRKSVVRVYPQQAMPVFREKFSVYYVDSKNKLRKFSKRTQEQMMAKASKNVTQAVEIESEEAELSELPNGS